MTPKRILLLLTALSALALLCAGCSSESPVAPGDADKGDPTGSTASLCHVYGNVDRLDGDPAVGVQVKIWVKSPYSFQWLEVATVTTGPYGDFSHDVYVYSGYQVRCASMGDVVTREWPGGAYMYFYLQQRKPIRNPYDMHEDPIPEP